MQLDLEAHMLVERERMSLEESHLDIIKRVFNDYQSYKQQNSSPADPGQHIPSGRNRRKSPATSRETGQFLVRVKDKQIFKQSQKSAYKQALFWLNDYSDGLFEKLSREQTSRGRKFVARHPSELYPKPGFEHFAEPLDDEWFVDLNLSRQQKIQRLKVAARLAGLTYGLDVDAGF